MDVQHETATPVEVMGRVRAESDRLGLTARVEHELGIGRSFPFRSSLLTRLRDRSSRGFIHRYYDNIIRLVGRWQQEGFIVEMSREMKFLLAVADRLAGVWDEWVLVLLSEVSAKVTEMMEWFPRSLGFVVFPGMKVVRQDSLRVMPGAWLPASAWARVVVPHETLETAVEVAREFKVEVMNARDGVIMAVPSQLPLWFRTLVDEVHVVRQPATSVDGVRYCGVQALAAPPYVPPAHVPRPALPVYVPRANATGLVTYTYVPRW